MRRKLVRNYLHTRVLAIDLHPRRFGYAVMEGPKNLLGWGVARSYDKTRNHGTVLGCRLRRLLRLWRPQVVLVKIDTRRRRKLKMTFGQLRQAAATIPLLPLDAAAEIH